MLKAMRIVLFVRSYEIPSWKPSNDTEANPTRNNSGDFDDPGPEEMSPESGRILPRANLDTRKIKVMLFEGNFRFDFPPQYYSCAAAAS
jgi:hypothetical protein